MHTYLPVLPGQPLPVYEMRPYLPLLRLPRHKPDTSIIAPAQQGILVKRESAPRDPAELAATMVVTHSSALPFRWSDCELRRVHFVTRRHPQPGV